MEGSRIQIFIVIKAWCVSLAIHQVSPRRKVRFGLVNPTGFVGGGKGGLSRVNPGCVPSGCDALSGEAVSWPSVMVGQAVPERQRFRGGEELHRAAPAPQAVAAMLTQGLP